MCLDFLLFQNSLYFNDKLGISNWDIIIQKEAAARFELTISCLLDRRFNQLSHAALADFSRKKIWWNQPIIDFPNFTKLFQQLQCIFSVLHLTSDEKFLFIYCLIHLLLTKNPNNDALIYFCVDIYGKLIIIIV